jgi:hypothetical protein
MNTFWLKIAALAVVVVAVIVLISFFSSHPAKEPAREPETKPKTFYDQVEKDKEKFLTKPKATVKEQVREQNQPENKQAPAEPTELYFKPLSETDKIEAERLLNVAVPGRSIGRLPGPGFKLMVDTCRQIIKKWPDSWYAYNAQRMLIDMPVRFRERYRITEEELDISKFTKQRPGTVLFTGTDTSKEESP